MTTTTERPPTEERTRTGTLHIMDADGDISISWDKNDPGDVAAAKAAWDKARSEEGGRKLGYRVEGEEGRRGEVLREFDPDAERLMMRPQLQGG